MTSATQEQLPKQDAAKAGMSAGAPSKDASTMPMLSPIKISEIKTEKTAKTFVEELAEFLAVSPDQLFLNNPFAKQLNNFRTLVRKDDLLVANMPEIDISSLMITPTSVMTEHEINMQVAIEIATLAAANPAFRRDGVYITARNEQEHQLLAMAAMAAGLKVKNQPAKLDTAAHAKNFAAAKQAFDSLPPPVPAFTDEPAETEVAPSESAPAAEGAAGESPAPGEPAAATPAPVAETPTAITPMSDNTKAAFRDYYARLLGTSMENIKMDTLDRVVADAWEELTEEKRIAINADFTDEKIKERAAAERAAKSLPFDETAQKAYALHLITQKKYEELGDTTKHESAWQALEREAQETILKSYNMLQPEKPAVAEKPAIAEKPAATEPPTATEPPQESEASEPPSGADANIETSENVLQRELTEKVLAYIKTAEISAAEYKRIRRRVVKEQSVTRLMLKDEFELSTKDSQDAVLKALRSEGIIRRRRNKSHSVLPAENGHMPKPQ